MMHPTLQIQPTHEDVTDELQVQTGNRNWKPEIIISGFPRSEPEAETGKRNRKPEAENYDFWISKVQTGV